tara:strand:- start:451 stop:978 length:528 start_codon:yes stop_codon:yes gene_type:complete
MISKTRFKNLIVIKKDKYTDKRGYFIEIVRNNVIKKNFPFLVMSFSKKNVLRGIHLQMKNTQGKYISVVKGKIFDVAVDLRRKSKTFGQYYSTILSEKNSRSLFIPEGFGHGFYSLANENYIIYSCTKYRDKQSEIGIKFDDPDLNIKWPGKKFILSDKDKYNLTFADFKKKFFK